MTNFNFFKKSNLGLDWKKLLGRKEQKNTNDKKETTIILVY